MAGQPIKLKRIHHIEFYVGNAKQAAYFYRKAFGFSQLAYSGLETGQRDLTKYVLAQGNISFLFTTPLNGAHPVNEQLRKHGDGVRDIAFEVDDAAAAFASAVANGATPIDEPHEHKDGNGAVMHSCIGTYGDTVHSFFSKGDYTGPFLPGFVSAEIAEPDSGLLVVDHVVGNVELGKMNYWAEFYEKVLGFSRYITFDDKDISTEFSALMSVVMSDDNQVVKFPINEPAEGKKKSQIQEYLDFYGGPGVQHIALLTKDIAASVTALMARGVEFLSVPDSYYAEVPSRVGAIDEDLTVLRRLGILVDRDDKGYLLQLFSKPAEDRPTLFFELIQRKGARGFGKGNFRALFESIEREQARRGNL
jgi:4-hydroxyphenylpyruvate dioxygenase